MSSRSSPAVTPSHPPTHAEILAAVQGFVSTPARTSAFVLLAASDDPEREVLLSRVLENRRERPQVRAAAAIALGHIRTEKAEQLLVQAVSTAPSDILPDVLRSLGRIGSPTALEIIDQHSASSIDLIATTARFAGALIAHRFGLPGHDLPVPSDADLLSKSSRDEHSIQVAQPSAVERRAVLASIALEGYGIDVAPDSLIQLRCGTDVNVLCLNRRFAARGTAATLLERKALLALAVLQSRETADHSVSYIVLAAPSSAGEVIDLLAPRCTGDPALAGSARLAGDEIRFSLRSVAVPGARALFLDGSIERGRIMFAKATYAKARRSAPTPAHAFRR
jgi:HEAT repeat protein